MNPNPPPSAAVAKLDDLAALDESDMSIKEAVADNETFCLLLRRLRDLLGEATEVAEKCDRLVEKAEPLVKFGQGEYERTINE